MILRPLNEIFQHKKSDIAVFLGSGSSINRITSEQWKKIESLDKWTINNWVYHPSIVPDFYHIEVKWYDVLLVKERLQEKRHLYENTNFIFRKGKHVKLENGTYVPVCSVVEGFKNVFEYEVIIRGGKYAPIPCNADYKIQKDILTLSYAVSLPSVIELIYKFGYKCVVFFGVDLLNSYYFWTGGDPKYGKVHHQTNKEHEGKDPNLPHNTVKVKDFIVDFNQRWMIPSGKEFVVGHKDTLLYPELRCVDLETL